MAFHARPCSPTHLPGLTTRCARRYAWTVFAVLFALMVVDYVDRQVVVSMFSHLKAQWDLSDSQLGALVSVVSVTVALGAVPLSLLADRWSRVKSIFLMALIWSLATIACAFASSYAQLFAARSVVGLGEAAYGTVGRGAARHALSAAHAQHGARGVPRCQHAGIGAGRGPRRRHRRTLGMAGRVRRRRRARAVPRVALPPDCPRLPDRGAARGQRRRRPCQRRESAPVAAELLRPRSAPIACVGAGLQLLVASTIYAWLPSYFNRSYGLAPDQAGLKAGLVVLGGGIGAVIWSVVADRLSVRRPSARLFVPAVASVLTTALLCPAFALLSPGPTQYAMLVAGGLVMVGTIGPDCRRRRRRHASQPACDRKRGPRAHAEPDRPRGGATADRFPFRPIRAAGRHGDGTRVLPARCGDVRAGGQDVRSGPEERFRYGAGARPDAAGAARMTPRRNDGARHP